MLKFSANAVVLAVNSVYHVHVA